MGRRRGVVVVYFRWVSAMASRLHLDRWAIKCSRNTVVVSHLDFISKR